MYDNVCFGSEYVSVFSAKEFRYGSNTRTWRIEIIFSEFCNVSVVIALLLLYRKDDRE
jgi:hypothetical protein